MKKDYIYGLLLADGNLSLYTRNRGRITIEVSKRDADIIYKLNKELPGGTVFERSRNTNFKTTYESIGYTNHLMAVRQALINRGFPSGKKDEICNPPIDSYSDKDFWRGFIDGDGSIGFIKGGVPYISIGTKSDTLYQAFIKFIKDRFGIIKHLHKNKRDNCYNIVLKNEDAINVATYLYDNADLYLDRKYNKYLEIKRWKRTVKKVNSKSWTADEDDYIISHTVIESMQKLNRTESSIKMRLYRLKINN